MHTATVTEFFIVFFLINLLFLLPINAALPHTVSTQATDFTHDEVEN